MIALCLAVVLTTWIVRRSMGEVVASSNGIFYPTVWLLVLAIVSLVIVLVEIRMRIRKGLPLPEWRMLAGSVMDVAVPFGLLLIAHLRSPRGEMAALAGDFPEFSAAGEGPAAVREWLERFAELYEREAAVIQTWTEAEISDSEFGRVGGNLVRQFIARIAAGIRGVKINSAEKWLREQILADQVDPLTWLRRTADQVFYEPEAEGPEEG